MVSLRSLKPRRRSISITPVQHASRRYRDDVHLIPTPGVEARRPDQLNSWPLTWKAQALAGLMIVIGIAVEIALALSNKHQGFAVSERNVFDFLHVQVSFLTSFFPTMFILPLSLFWGISDSVLRWFQPYVVLSQGNARAEDSIMMNYITSNRLITLWKVTQRRQWIIYFSMITAFAVNLYQPLAGSLLTVKNVSIQTSTTVEGTTALGLAPDFESLNAFLAAAGFTEAAAFQSLPDPPFVSAGWASAQFNAAKEGMATTISAETTGIRTTAHCESPLSAPTVDTSDPTSFTISTSLQDGCSSRVTFDPSSAEQQYGTTSVDYLSCGLPADFPQQYAPVMFWFYHNITQNQPQASAVICRPTIELFNIVANVDLSNNNLTGVTIRNTYTTPNNVSGDPLNGNVFNAVLFGDIPRKDKFIQARATAVGAQIPGAIFRFASQDAGTLQRSFDSPDGFLNLTTRIYTQHLSVTAKTVYFIPTSQSLSAKKEALQERLVVEKFAGHALASLLIVIGIIGIALHTAHRQVRRNVHLYTQPGAISSTVALTSHSGFGDLLYPFDDKYTIRKKLEKFRFSLDKRTGAIVADEVDSGDQFAMDAMSNTYRDDEEDDKTELSRVGSKAPLLSDADGRKSAVSRASSGSPSRSRELALDLPYEVEPLVLPHSRSSSRSPSGIRSPDMK